MNNALYCVLKKTIPTAVLFPARAKISLLPFSDLLMILSRTIVQRYLVMIFVVDVLN